MPGLVTNERLSTLRPIDLETFPFWGQPVIRVWLVLHDDTSTHLHLCYPRVPIYGYSRFPGQFRCPVQLLWLFFPLSTRVYQARAEGRGCLPFTREAGVIAIPPPLRYH
jgi:hypothetical protein